MEREELIRLRIVECNGQLKKTQAMGGKAILSVILHGRFPIKDDLMLLNLYIGMVDQLRGDRNFFQSLLEDHQDGQDHP